jgi:CSLREA domain-containing protein
MHMTKGPVLRRLVRGLASALIALALLAPSAAHAATIAVTTTTDVINSTDGLCSLREAIIAANTNTASGPGAGECVAGTGTDLISLPAGTYTLTIAPTGANDATSGDLNITQALDIVGTGSPTVVGGGGWADRIFDIASGVAVSMSGFTISGGNRAITTGVDGGGGIRSDGPLTLTTMTISGNAVTQSGGALGPGGGIFIGDTGGSLTITNSTISGNSSQSPGAGLYSQSTVNMSGTTVSGNNSVGMNTGTGGALIFLSAPGSTATITNSTIANNTAGPGFGTAGGIDIEANNSTPRTATLRNVTISGNSNPTTGGLSSFGNQMVLTLIDTLVAGNSGSTAPDCSNQASANITSGGNNLIGDNTGCTITNLQASDQIGTSGSPINPLLGLLANNGGPTQTMALLAGSPAINAGNNGTCALTDQRGFVRPAGVNCDIGAFEAGAVGGVAPVITNGPPPNGTVGILYSFTYTATGTAPITFIVASGALPNGLTLSSGGVLSGTPSLAGTFNGTVTASNGTLPDATQNFSIVISPAAVSVAPIPTLSGQAMLLLASLLALFAFVALRHRRPRR